MSKDIVERLRRCKENIGQPVWAFNHAAVRDTIETAAAAIEALRAERDAAREALEECESVLRRVGCDVTADIARAALAAKEANGE